MKMSIREIKDRGSNDERVVLIVNEDCNLGYFVVASTKRVSETQISTTLSNPFWIPNKDAKKGDLVVIYSKTGTSSFKVNEDKTTSHFYYRGFPSAILSNGYIALVLELNTWTAEKSQ